MLEYEKRLHFDERYERMKSGKTGQIVGMAVLAVAQYILLYLLFRWLQMTTGDPMLWRKSSVWFRIEDISFIKLDVLYFGVGLLIQIYGMLALGKVSAENHSVRDKEKDTPDQLLKSGMYKKKRHPMYGIFIILQSGFLLSVRSAYCLAAAVLVAVFYVFHAKAEEKRSLVPLFQDEYLKYQKETPRMLLSNIEIGGLMIGLIVGIIGIWF